jgi:hypothetical protein
VNNVFHIKKYIVVIFCIGCMPLAEAHHVLGRPAYSLSEESNTPPSMQVETQIGKFFVTYMAFPAFPKPGEQGRVNLYAARIDNGNTYKGKVTFKVRDDSWFSSRQETLGVQNIDDGVYRQGFEFNEAGDYIITAEFEAAGEPYIIDFPLRIGKPFPIGPLGVSVGVILVSLFLVNIMQRRRLQRLQAQRHHQQVNQ